MRASVYSNKLLIGNAVFKKYFGAMGHIYGTFYPAADYSLIKKQVQKYWSAYLEDYANLEDWHAFRFNVQLENGYYILPVGGYEIFDFPDSTDEEMEIHLAGIHSHIYFDYFENDKPFLLAPWSQLSIAQKIDVEDELQKTISPQLMECSALAINESSHETLFSINGKNPNTFMIVKSNLNGCANVEHTIPEENYFIDLDDFTNRRMMVDNYNLTHNCRPN